jgi:hypothetical protein
MKNGGVPRFAGGNLVTEDGMTTDFAYNDEDGSLYKPLGTNEYGESYAPVLGNRGYMRSNAVSASNSLSDGEEIMERILIPEITNLLEFSNDVFSFYLINVIKVNTYLFRIFKLALPK